MYIAYIIGHASDPFTMIYPSECQWIVPGTVDIDD